MLKLTEKENKSVYEMNGRRCPHRLIVFIAYIVGNLCWVKVRSDDSPFLRIAYYVLRFSFTFSLRNFHFVSYLR
jgi:hypothetical protein